MRIPCACADHGLRARWATLTLPLIFSLLILTSPTLAAEPKFPPLTGRVVDDAGVLNAATLSELTEMLADHERATGQQVVVVTLPSLQGYTIEDFGYQLGRNWGVGQKGKNTGVLLIVAPQEHKVRIEVGYGLEGELTDAICSTIIQNYVTPSFKRGDFNAGVLAGTTSILRVLSGSPLETGEPATSSGEGSSEPASSNKSVSNVPESIGLAVLGLFYLIPLIGIVLLVRTLISSGRKFHWSGSQGWHSNGGSSGGSSDDDDDFSEGGGSFGGGGASGSW